MFLQETNIDKNYVPGKIRTTWVDTKLYLPPPSSDSKDRVFYVTGILYCFSAGFWFENSFFLIDDRGYRPWMLNCKEILSPYLLKFWLSVVICTYKYMYNIVIGFFIEIMKLGRVASMISDMILFMTDQSSRHICWVEFIVIYGLLKCEQTWEFV